MFKKKFLIMKNNHAPHKKNSSHPLREGFFITSWNDRMDHLPVYLQGNFLRSYLGPKFLYAHISPRTLTLGDFTLTKRTKSLNEG